MGAGKEVAERLTVYVDCLSPLGKELKILNQPCAVREDLCVVILCELSQTADSTSAHTERGGQGFRSPLDNLRKAVSSESGRIIRTDRSA